ncbi:hypothetical protein [Streptomyces europaeiscabiei]|uniref:hypothetical protein n=2 Tax=Streptomyces europaeiscabiei TaxID=146819 RepID=UPI0029ADCD8F|nr:hypothetical protein [Streptomyces europaeiscabiei]MDX3673418.1 hypothetical protein [Streptomyces europaeiscabiei]MDX3864941.1 hypothetical protein [Streptomyces europaeiscabiei]MDX3872406.1 hypothetical protein [Streptomyces europaeiscabiei]
MRHRAGDREGGEALAYQAAHHGDTDALNRLAAMREEAGDREGAESLAWQAADHGDTDVLHRLAMTREGAGDREGAESLARQFADHDETTLYRSPIRRELLNKLWPDGLDPDGTPTPPWQP